MIEPRIPSALALADRTDLTILSTLDGDGTPDARAIFNLRKMRASIFRNGAAAPELAFATWIATNTSSRKVRELRNDTRGSLYYHDADSFEGLTLQGTFEEVHDRDVRAAIWIDSWAMYYPGGLEGNDFSVFRFHPLRARYYHGLSVLDFTPSQSRLPTP